MVSTQTLIFGLVIGSYIGLAAIGFSLIHGLVNMFNIAHGEYMTIGAYLSFVLMNQLGLGLFVSLVLGIAATSIAGLAIAKFFYQPLYETGPIPLLLTSIGLSFLLRNVIQLGFGADNKYLEGGLTGVYRTDALGGFFLQYSQALVIALALLTILLLHLLLTRTELGIAMRATSNNETLAQITGVATIRIRDYVWLLASGTAGLSGILLAQQRTLTPALGYNDILIILTAAILGGAGNVYGAVAAGFFLGIVSATATSMLPSGMASLATSVIFFMLIVALIVKSHVIEGNRGVIAT